MATTPQITKNVEDLFTLYTGVFVDLPLATLKRGIGLGSEKDTAEAGWKSYDASVRLATSLIDTVYQTSLFGEFTARTLQTWLRGRRIGQAASSVFFTLLWQSVGLPTAAETQAFRAEIQALREDMEVLQAITSERTKKKPLAEIEERIKGLHTKQSGTDAAETDTLRSAA